VLVLGFRQGHPCWSLFPLSDHVEVFGLAYEVLPSFRSNNRPPLSPARAFRLCEESLDVAPAIPVNALIRLRHPHRKSHCPLLKSGHSFPLVCLKCYPLGCRVVSNPLVGRSHGRVVVKFGEVAAPPFLGFCLWLAWMFTAQHPLRVVSRDKEDSYPFVPIFSFSEYFIEGKGALSDKVLNSLNL